MDIAIWNVDTQEDFMREDGALSVPKAMKIVDRLTAIHKAAAEKGVQILGSADDHNDKSAEFAKNGGPFPDHCVRGTPGQLNIPETFLGSGKVGIVKWDQAYGQREINELLSKPQVILTKDDNDVFTSPHIEALLNRLPQDMKIFVIGVATEYCDRCAIIGLVNWGRKNGKNWEVAVVIDAIKEITPEGGAKALEEFRQLGVSFVRTSDVLKQIDAIRDQLSATLKSAARVEPQRTRIK